MGNQAQVTIIGGGIIGCAIARELQHAGLQVLVIEKERSSGMGITSRNSEVIHAGLYYPPNSLKAKLCHEGRILLYEYCKTYAIPHRKLGKYIVATNEQELSSLEEIQRTAATNGVPLRSITAKELTVAEPMVASCGALYSPESGIVSAHDLTKSLQSHAEAYGAQFAFQTQVIGIEYAASEWRLNTEAAHNGGHHFSLSSQSIINCSGLFSDTIAASAGIDTNSAGYTQHWVKGEYFALAAKWGRALRSLIYPVPEKNLRGLGVHVTLDMGGQAKLGPNVVEQGRVEDYTVDSAHQRQFFEAGRKFLPTLEFEDLTPAYSGIRPKLSKSCEASQDFIIREESARGCPRLINLLGIESPGLTSALAIARYVRENFFAVGKTAT